MENLKTYAEENNKTPFDWNEFLNKPEITFEEWDKVRTHSVKWTTCACGNQCDIIPRDFMGKPNDNLLADLGFRFHMEILSRDQNAAKLILTQIEERSKVLINKILTQN